MFVGRAFIAKPIIRKIDIFSTIISFFDCSREREFKEFLLLTSQSHHVTEIDFISEGGTVTDNRST